MKNLMPALQKAKPGKFIGEGLSYESVALPKQKRDTRIVKDMAVDQIAKEIVDWVRRK